MKAGEFIEVIISEREDIAFPELRDAYPEIRSRTAHYRDRNGTTHAEVHYYVDRPGGDIIPNKRPDPKLLMIDGKLHHKEKLKNRLKRLAVESVLESEELEDQ